MSWCVHYQCERCSSSYKHSKNILSENAMPHRRLTSPIVTESRTGAGMLVAVTCASGLIHYPSPVVVVDVIECSLVVMAIRGGVIFYRSCLPLCCSAEETVDWTEVQQSVVGPTPTSCGGHSDQICTFLFTFTILAFDTRSTLWLPCMTSYDYRETDRMMPFWSWSEFRHSDLTSDVGDCSCNWHLWCATVGVNWVIMDDYRAHGVGYRSFRTDGNSNTDPRFCIDYIHWLVFNKTLCSNSRDHVKDN